MTQISSWGRLGVSDSKLIFMDPLQPLHSQLAVDSALPGLAFGMGRSYGDVGLNPNSSLWMMGNCDNWISFDLASGILRCQAGVQLGDIQRTLAPQGWMLPVTPGTQYVTVGGAIANNVHGKNHHRAGSFGDHVVSLSLLRTDLPNAIQCSATHNPAWFQATVGGLGLTGIITEATLQLQKVQGPWLDTETIAFTRLDEFFQLAAESEEKWEYTVSWIDCLHPHGRGIFLRSNHAQDPEQFARKAPHDQKKTMPFVPPVSLVNQLSLKPFNTLYYHAQKNKRGLGTSHYAPFFYPLDNLLHWNRLYGPRGFYQYQCVVPPAAGAAAVNEMLSKISQSGQGSFLAVLKTFGNRPSQGMLSFPRPGVTLALDFPHLGDSTLKLLETLDAIVKEAGGRLYPAKDARMSADFFRASYPLLNEFMVYRDPGISSGMSRRLMGF